MSLVSVAESKFPSLALAPALRADHGGGGGTKHREREGDRTRERERESERYHLSGKQSGKSDRVLDIDTALPFSLPSLAVAAPAPALAGRGASLGNMLTLLASESEGTT